MIWLALIFPLVTVVILYIFWKHRISIFETSGVMIIPILFILCSKGCVEYQQTRDKEFLGGWVKQAEYYQAWNEYIHRTCTRQNCHGSGENRVCTTEFYDCSYVEYHPEHWDSVTTLGTFGMSKDRFDKLCSQFGNKTFVDLHRSYHTIDGDKYVSNWPNTRETMESVSAEHEYENRTQAADCVYKYPEVDPKTYGLLEYPGIDGNGKQNCVIGAQVPDLDRARKNLDYWNATLGPKKRTRIFILLFKDKPVQAGFDQQFYWKNGNKNEMNIVIGVKSTGTVDWCHVFSWSEKEDLKVDIRNKVVEMDNLDLPGFIEWLGPEMDRRFKKRDFREFSYLKVEPPLWYIITAYIVVILMCIGFGIFAVKNDLNMEGTDE